MKLTREYIEMINKYHAQDIEQMIIDAINNPGNHSRRIILCEKVEVYFKPFHRYYTEMASRKIKTTPKRKIF